MPTLRGMSVRYQTRLEIDWKTVFYTHNLQSAYCSSFLNTLICWVAEQLSEDRSSLVWSTTREQAAHLLALPEEDFTEALNRAIVRILM